MEEYPAEFQTDIMHTVEEAAQYFARHNLTEISQKLIDRHKFSMAVDEMILRGILTPEIESPIVVYGIDLQFVKGYLKERASENPEQVRLQV